MSRFIDEGELPNFRRLRALLSEAGATVGICGSMNANYTHLRGYIVPDPWSKHAGPHPEWLSGYYNYVAARVQESSRDGSGPTGSAVRFAATLMRAGLSANTVWQTVRQVASECMDKGLAWRKAGLLDLYQYDLFRGLNARRQVQFATFFSNCVAHYQHYYWRNMSPELFANPPLPSDHGSAPP